MLRNINRRKLLIGLVGFAAVFVVFILFLAKKSESLAQINITTNFDKAVTTYRSLNKSSKKGKSNTEYLGTGTFNKKVRSGEYLIETSWGNRVINTYINVKKDDTITLDHGMKDVSKVELLTKVDARDIFVKDNLLSFVNPIAKALQTYSLKEKQFFNYGSNSPNTYDNGGAGMGRSVSDVVWNNSGNGVGLSDNGGVLFVSQNNVAPLRPKPTGPDFSDDLGGEISNVDINNSGGVVFSSQKEVYYAPSDAIGYSHLLSFEYNPKVRLSDGNKLLVLPPSQGELEEDKNAIKTSYIYNIASKKRQDFTPPGGVVVDANWVNKDELLAYYDGSYSYLYNLSNGQQKMLSNSYIDMENIYYIKDKVYYSANNDFWVFDVNKNSSYKLSEILLINTQLGGLYINGSEGFVSSYRVGQGGNVGGLYKFKIAE